MKFNILLVTSRSVTLELDNHDIYESKEAFDVFVDDVLVYENHKRNVLSIYGLLPQKDYTITIMGKTSALSTSHSITTAYEYVSLNVRDFGAIGDGIHDDSAAIQTAILACPDFGRVYLPKGTYVSAPIFLKSNILIELEKGTIILGHTDITRYGILPGLVPLNDGSDDYNLGSWEGNPLPQHASQITGINVKNVTIIGEATIDCNAEKAGWWDNHRVPKRGAWRPNGVFLNQCENIVFQGVAITNTGAWNLHPYFSKNISFLDMKLISPKDSPNTDGCDPESCDGVDIIGVDFSVGDDCIAIKSGKIYMGAKYKKPSENFQIRNCLMEFGHGAVVFGSENSGGIRNIWTERCIFRKTDRGLRIKTRRGRGKDAIIDGITFKNILMDEVLSPLVINMYYDRCDPDGLSEYVYSKKPLPIDERTPFLGEFTFKDMTCTNVEVAAGFFYGLPEMPIKKITIENVTFSYKEDAEPGYPAMMQHLDPMAKKGLYFNFVDDVELSNVTVIDPEGDEVEYHHVKSFKKA